MMVSKQIWVPQGRASQVEDLLSCAQPADRVTWPTWMVELVDDLHKLKDSVAGCPYYTAHVLAGDADIVFCPQNYILDPSVSQCRSHHRERWSLQGRIVIIDEAHNVEQCCREAGSLEISSRDLWQMSRTLRQMPLRWLDSHKKAYGRGGDGSRVFLLRAAAGRRDRCPARHQPREAKGVPEQKGA
eukprot:Skav214214  [mRNA]  locus=scaffold489:398885:406570:- [translate_table: standard]